MPTQTLKTCLGIGCRLSAVGSGNWTGNSRSTPSARKVRMRVASLTVRVARSTEIRSRPCVGAVM
ncbi:hypothetical protein D3C78_1637220 [compost metagenome]